jgi:hypothetical protein
MNEADKAYMAGSKAEEDEHDPWEFIAQQVKGVIAFAAIVLGVWMLVGAVVLK